MSKQPKYSYIAAVTGANKGIGLATVRALALRHAIKPHPKVVSSKPQKLIYLTSRDPARGKTALNQLLSSEPALDPDTSGVLLKHHTLNVTSCQSVGHFKAAVLQNGRLNLLINNAGVASTTQHSAGTNTPDARQVVATNFCGTKKLCTNMIPTMQDGGNIVNVASIVGKLGRFSEELQTQFRQRATTGSVDSMQCLMADFLFAHYNDSAQAKGWALEGRSPSAYAVSKAGVVGLTAVLARVWRDLCPNTQVYEKGITINCVCPGFVATDLTNGRGSKDLEAAAEKILFAASADRNRFHGKFISRGEVVDW